MGFKKRGKNSQSRYGQILNIPLDPPFYAESKYVKINSIV